MLAADFRHLRDQISQLESLASELITEGQFENEQGMSAENKVAYRIRLNTILGIKAGGGA